MRTIALISCGKRKCQHRTRAIDLYEGDLFKKSLKYVRTRLDIPDCDIYILSAKYGLLSHETEIDPYNETLKGKGAKQIRIWSQGVIRQLQRISDLDVDHFELFAGLEYRRDLIPYLKNCKIPMKGMRQGEQLKWLKSKLS